MVHMIMMDVLASKNNVHIKEDHMDNITIQ